MNYFDKESLEATIKSYMEAFLKLSEYCTCLEPSGNEFNWRVALPTKWRPFGHYNTEKLRKNANYLNTHHAELFEMFNKPRLLNKGYTDWDKYFSISWEVQIPFDIYTWECGVAGYINEKGDTIPAKPTKMVKWYSPQYLSLGNQSGWSMKSWALPDWWAKHNEIESFMDDNPILKEQYRKAVLEADEEIKRWQQALKEVNEATKIFQ